MVTLRKRLIEIKYSIGKITGPIWYRFFGYKHHIIKTSLKPAVWYDTDTRLLYAVMDTVKWFVDNDMNDQWTDGSVEEEIERIKIEEPEESQAKIINLVEQSYEADQAAIRIAEWWKNYPAREKEIEEEDNYYKVTSLESQLNKEEQEMLLEVIRRRGSMWS
jgi:hypothetical protein